MRTSRKLLQYVRRHIGVLWAAVLLSAVLGLLESLRAILVGHVFVAAFGKAATEASGTTVSSGLKFLADFSLNDLLILLIVTTIVKVLTEYGAVTASAYLGQSVVQDIRNDVFNNILHQPLRFFDRNPTGELMSRISADIERIQSAASDTLAEALKQTAVAVFMIGTILYLDWKLTLASLVLIPLVLYPSVWFGRRLRSLSRSNQKEMADMSNVMYEAFSGNRIVKAFLMEKAENRRFAAVTGKLFRTNLRQRMTHALSSPLMETLGVLAVASYVLYASRHGPPENMVAFIVVVAQLYDAVRRMSGISNSFQQGFGASDRIFEIMGKIGRAHV